MAIVTFRRNDAGYIDWLDANLDGFVVNSNIPPNAGYLVLHRAQCPTIRKLQSTARSWTASYQKTCSGSVAELQAWASSEVGGRLTACPICQAPPA